MALKKDRDFADEKTEIKGGNLIKKYTILFFPPIKLRFTNL
jgi:hypothetical protein